MMTAAARSTSAGLTGRPRQSQPLRRCNQPPAPTTPTRTPDHRNTTHVTTTAQPHPTPGLTRTSYAGRDDFPSVAATCHPLERSSVGYAAFVATVTSGKSSQ
jgi:hypothetical protein